MPCKIKNIQQEFDTDKIYQELKNSNGYGGDIFFFTEYETLLDSYIKTGEPKDMEWVKSLYNAGYVDPITHAYTHNPGVHFCPDIIYFLDNYLGTICLQSWVNELRPGEFLPLHKDDDNKDHLEELGTIEMYCVHIGDPDPGHLFFLENHCCYMEPPGTVYKWDNRFSLHGGANIGYTNKYILLYLGLRPHESFEFEYVWSYNMEPMQIKLSDGKIL